MHKKYKKIYILCPALIATGGPELLHQLAFKLKRLGQEVYMAYLNEKNKITTENPPHDSYKKYDVDFTDLIDDHPDHLIIAPEIYPSLLFKYKYINKALWWQSIDNYFFNLRGFRGLINRQIRKRFFNFSYVFFNTDLKEINLHFTQSYYAKDFLNGKGILGYMLSDYISEDITSCKTDENNKENIVTYNPKKGIKFTKKIIQASKNIRFVPLVNLSRPELIETLKASKVYIDFGNHPGKDRIPREAALLKNCIITGKRGSSKYFEDVPISDEYKFNESDGEIKNIVATIQDCICNHETRFLDFNEYCKTIKNEENIFDKEIKNIFFKG